MRDTGSRLDSQEQPSRGFDTTLRNLERIRAAGGTVSVGTDSYGCYLNLPGFYWKELELMTNAGFSTGEALKAATHVNAKILGVEKNIGSIAAGKYADFVLVKGDPLADLGNLRNVRMVVKGGVAYRDAEPVVPQTAERANNA